MKNIFALPLFAFFLVIGISSCDSDDNGDGDNGRVTHIIELGDGAQADFQETLINIQEDEVIQFEAGTYNFDNTISGIGVKNVTIIGAGINETILSFAAQTAGAQGLKLDDMDGLLLANLTIQDASGDNVKIKGCNGVSMINVGAVYTGDPSEDNGAYGLYPVECENVLIDGCYIRGASDAGIYVGQSSHVIVRNNTVEYNVAGIEVENCLYSDVYGNDVSNNTGGVLVFDLPGLEIIPQGGYTRVYNNDIYDNNHANFAPEGNIVGTVPPGTGIMVLASRECEIFNNNIDRNNMLGVAIVSYEVIGVLSGNQNNDTLYDPYTYLINIHDNNFSRGTAFPEATNATSNILTGPIVFGSFENATDIVHDGITNPDVSWDEQRTCLNNNTNATASNAGLNNFPTGTVTYGLEQFACTIEPLAEVTITAPTLADRGF